MPGMPTPTAQVSTAARTQPAGIVSRFGRTWKRKNPAKTPTQMTTLLPRAAAAACATGMHKASPAPRQAVPAACYPACQMPATHGSAGEPGASGPRGSLVPRAAQAAHCRHAELPGMRRTKARE
jgi:hypothetical protein